MLLQRLGQKNLIHPPKFIYANTMYLTRMGSVAYGVSQDSSDLDIYGFCVPPKEMVFPHLSGEIPGFGRQIQRFESWSEHHVKEPDSQKTYDFCVFSIVKLFDLAMNNNPNVIDCLFTSRENVIHSTIMSELVREHRRMFLHKGAMHRLRGYAFSQMSKIRNKTNASNPKRASDIEQHGMDLKFAYHVARLVLQAEQILLEGDLDLLRNRELLKSIRRGEWSFQDLETWFNQKEKDLETHMANSKLPNLPPEHAIKQLLMQCLEMHYGSLSQVVHVQTPVETLLQDLEQLILKYKA